MKTAIRLALTGTLALLVCGGTALAQRGGGRAGGARPGAGAGGGGGAGGARPSFNRTPSFNAPAARPQAPAARPMPAPGAGGGAARPQAPVARPMPAPGLGGAGGRPGPGTGPQVRPNPTPLPGLGAGNRPNTGNRPGGVPGPGPGVPTGPGPRPPLGGNAGNNVVNRPNIGNNVVNRPNIGNNVVNRPNIGNNVVNRPNIGNNVVNRPNIGNNVVNRPNIGNNVVNRPNIGNNIVNRPNIGNNVVNRPNIGNNVVNRPNIGNNIVNRPNIGNNINSGNTIINNNTNIVKNINVNRPAWTNGNPAWAYRPGAGYHQGWVNGYWHGQNNSSWWNNGGAFWTGMAVGGIGAWGVGSTIFNWGYRPYVNPYMMTTPVVIQQPVVIEQPVPTVVVQQPAPTTVVVQQPATTPVAEAPPVDYGQPLSSSTPPPDPAVADPAIATFDAGRAAFKEGNYAMALQKTDEALKAMPTDAAMHEFRALCLFALKQYEQSASTLYAVLSAGPGWDWTTLAGLYPSVDVYTTQLRALEDYRSAHLDSAPARFVLAYHYLTQGHTDNAVAELKEVVKLQPSDQLSSQMVAQLTGEPGKPGDAEAPAAATVAQAPPLPADKLLGQWTASPAQGTTIALSLSGDSKFKWEVQAQGKTQPIEGNYTYEDGVLTLTQSDSNQMVGKVAQVDDNHFKFQAMGGGPGDPGLAFGR